MTKFDAPVFDLPSERGGKDFGIFMPIANGGWIISETAPEIDGSYAYNRKAALLADEIGLDFIMSMAKFRGYGGKTQHWNTSLDSLVLMSALAAQTKRVKIWTTFHTLLQNPAVAAKMISTLDQVSDGRVGLNVVPGSFQGEFSQMGAWPQDIGHDERYDLADEWVAAVKALWRDPSVTMKGKYFSLEDCESNPKPVQKPRPFIVAAGMSERGMKFTIEHTDAIFIGGRDDAEMRDVSLKAKKMAADAGRRLRTYAMLNLIIAETDAAAGAEVDRISAGFDEEAFRGVMRSYGMIDSEIGKENAMTSRARSGFMAPYVAGSEETVFRRMCEAIENAQLDGLMLIFPDYEYGLKKIASSILPRLRERFGS